MPGITPKQYLRRRRFEAAIALVAPVLDLILAAGERVSRLVGRDDHGHYPIRPGETFALGPGDSDDARSGGA